MSEHETTGVAVERMSQEPEEMSGLVRLAIQEKVPVEVLERIVALQERVSDRNARAAFYEALAAFHDECPPIKKTRENTQFEVTRGGVKRPSKYAPLEEIDQTARPVAAKHGLVWTWDQRVEGAVMHITCRLMHVMGHVEESTVVMPLESKAGSSAQQKYGSAQTYGMRYSLIAALGLTAADEDVDGAGPNGEQKTITEEQCADLKALGDEVKQDWPKFLAWAKVEKLEDLPAAKLAQASRTLQAKRGAR